MNNIAKLVESELRAIEDIIFSLIDLNGNVTASINEFLRAPSKRIRSIFALLYLKLNNSFISQDVLNVLAATELIHSASLLHDDVIDDSSIRRDMTTLSKKYSSKIAILSGDLLISKAINLILKINKPEIIEKFLRCTEGMCSAEIKQYELKGVIPDLDDYIEIIKGKTTGLFIAVLESVAVLADISDDYAHSLSEIFGIVFQMRNDLEPVSAEQDKKNGVNTISEIIGIENALSLIDNYKQEMLHITEKYPQNKYRIGLESLIKLL